MNLRTLLTGLAVLVLATSCTAGSEGIFATIEKEQKVVTSGNLNTAATVTRMAELITNTTTNAGVLLVSGGEAAFTKSNSTSVNTWGTSSVGQHGNVAAVGVAGSTAYAVAGGGLYQSTDGSNWSAGPSLAAGDTPYDLIPIRNPDGVTSNKLILVTMISYTDPNNSSVTIYQYGRIYLLTSGGLSATPITLTDPTGASSALGDPVISAAIDDGSNYYLASNSYLWYWNGTQTTVAATTNFPSNTGFGGLIYLGTPYGTTTLINRLYVSTGIKSGTTTGGGIYVSAVTSGSPSANWGTITQGTTTSNLPVAFGQFLYNNINNSLWIATRNTTGTSQQGTGYMEYTLSSSSFSTTPSTNSSNYSSSGLSTYAVGCLFYSLNGGGLYYLGTRSHGLWYWNETGNSSNPWTQD